MANDDREAAIRSRSGLGLGNKPAGQDDRVTEIPRLRTPEMQRDYAIMTVLRSEPYIHRLLASLPAGLKPRIIVGSPDTGYLDRITGLDDFEILIPTQTEWATIKNRIVHERASWNYWRCLSLGTRLPSARGLVIFEDDVVLALDWSARLDATVAKLDADYGPRYALALYSAYAPNTRADPHVLGYDISSFYGTQAMYYPNPVREGFRDYLKKYGVDAYEEPYDLLLKKYLKQEGFLLFRCQPSLAQHIGRVSTGLGKFHESPSFNLKL
jgi:hypothetical protein